MKWGDAVENIIKQAEKIPNDMNSRQRCIALATIFESLEDWTNIRADHLIIRGMQELLENYDHVTGRKE